MAGFPHRESHRNRPRLNKNLPVSVPCPLSGGTTRARTALKVERYSNFCPASGQTESFARTSRAQRTFALLWFLKGLQRNAPMALGWGASNKPPKLRSTETGETLQFIAAAAPCRSSLLSAFGGFVCFSRKPPERSISRRVMNFNPALYEPFYDSACAQSCLDATLLTGLQVVGVTLDFLDDVLLLYLPLEPAQRIFQRFAFLYANLCQNFHLQTCL
jgi:hypothetical protein